LNKKRGQQSIAYADPPVIVGTAAIGGPMEGQGLLADYFHYIMQDNLHGEDSWEKCEAFMLEWVARRAAQSLPGGMELTECVLAGDLLNQRDGYAFCHASVRQTVYRLIWCLFHHG